MNKKIIGAIFLLVLLSIGLYFLLAGVSHKNLDIDVSGVTKSVTIKHFDDAFFTSDTLKFGEEIATLEREYSPFFMSNNNPDFWLSRRKEKNQIHLYSDWKKQNPTNEKLDKDLEEAFKHLYFYYPTLPKFSIYTYISNLDFDYPVILAENFVFLASDLYLGKEHPAYQNQNAYLNYNRQNEFMVSDVMEQFALNFNSKDLNDNTLLNEMVWWGKNIYFRQAMQPLMHDTITTRMSSQNLNFCLQNEVNMWLYFIDNKLLFDTNDQIKRKFIAPAPFSKFGMPFDNQTPGMVGRWLGYKIVAAYMNNNPTVSLQDLMANSNSKLIFKNSKYKP